MSATGRGIKRHPDDFYATPAWCTRAILRRLKLPATCSVLDSSCGTGAILDVLENELLLAKGIEIDETRASACPKCGEKIRKSSSDATEYAWFVWGEDHANKWEIL